MKRIYAIILASIMTLGAFAASAASAADCTPTAGGVYVCDAREVLPPFSQPERRPDSILGRLHVSWIEDYAPLYAEPRPDAPVLGDAGVGFLYSSIQGVATDAAGGRWYKVNGGWTPAGYIHIVEGTDFAGVEVNQQPERPFGWVMDKFVPRSTPDGDLIPGARQLQRYDFVEIYGVAQADSGWVWYDIGGGRWIKANYLALVDVAERPAEVGPDEFWVDVNLYEQSFAAYEGDRMVYATVISSGLDRWATREGLFQVWSRHLMAPMSGGEAGDDFYALTHVPHTMYFDGGISLHGAYWHNLFGHQKSHGCVNMPPRDSEWVYFWSAQAPSDLWVWVHDVNPEHLLQKYDSNATAALG